MGSSEGISGRSSGRPDVRLGCCAVAPARRSSERDGGNASVNRSLQSSIRTGGSKGTDRAETVISECQRDARASDSGSTSWWTTSWRARHRRDPHSQGSCFGIRSSVRFRPIHAVRTCAVSSARKPRRPPSGHTTRTSKSRGPVGPHGHPAEVRTRGRSERRRGSAGWSSPDDAGRPIRRSTFDTDPSGPDERSGNEAVLSEQ